jgi:hypothetical protein
MDPEERRRSLELQAMYNKRITVAKSGRQAFVARNYTISVKQYTEYLSILCHAKNVHDIFKLAPKDFDEKTPVSELLLISHVYWDLSKMYESSPSFADSYSKALNQFVTFTANQPYQVLNSEMVRKYIKRRKKAKSVKVELLQITETYQDIFAQSKSCFVASYCFGDLHPKTNTLRLFKLELLNWPLGTKLVHYYYKFSPKFIELAKSSKLIDKITRLTIVPALSIFAFFTQTSIFKLCSSYLKLLRNRGSNH